MTARRNLLLSLAAGGVVSAILTWTFGWVGTLLLNMPGFFTATLVEGQNVSRFRGFIFLGDVIFYVALFWGALELYRSVRARIER